MAVLFCLGLEVYTCYNTPTGNTEISSNLNDEENNIVTSVDSFEDEQIIHVYEPAYFIDQLKLIPLTNELSLLKEFPLSNWQPPRFC